MCMCVCVCVCVCVRERERERVLTHTHMCTVHSTRSNMMGVMLTWSPIL